MGDQGLLLLMELKLLIMMTSCRLQNVTVVCHHNFETLADNSNVLQPGHHYQKILIPLTARALGHLFNFTSLPAQPFLDSWPQLLH